MSVMRIAFLSLTLSLSSAVQPIDSWDALRNYIAGAPSSELTRTAVTPVFSNGTPYLEQARQMACIIGIKDPALAAAVIDVESSWNHDAIGSKGEEGPGQVLPSTAAQYQLDRNRLRDELYGLYAAFFVLKTMFDRFGNEADALRGYNAGAGYQRLAVNSEVHREIERYVLNVQRRKVKYAHLTCH